MYFMKNKISKEEQDKFSYTIDCLFADVNKKQSTLSYLDVISDYCEATGLELELAAKLINSNLKEKIELQANSLNLMKMKTKTLFNGNS